MLVGLMVAKNNNCTSQPLFPLWPSDVGDLKGKNIHSLSLCWLVYGPRRCGDEPPLLGMAEHAIDGGWVPPTMETQHQPAQLERDKHLSCLSPWDLGSFQQQPNLYLNRYG